MSLAELRFVGVGGQGVILAGEILSAAKIEAGGYGVKASTYTSQVRGGPTKVDIILSDEEINSQIGDLFAFMEEYKQNHAVA